MSLPSPMAFPKIDELPLSLQAEVANRRSLHVYQMIMHTPQVAPGFLGISDALRHKTSLPGDWRELAILRVGHHYQAPYEIHHHERLGRSVGLSEQQLAATRLDGDVSSLDERGKEVLRLTDELIERHGLSQSSRDQALTWMSTNQLADLVLTVGFYQMVCNFLRTFAVPIET